jgi:hypothetical protein
MGSLLLHLRLNCKNEFGREEIAHGGFHSVSKSGFVSWTGAHSREVGLIREIAL